MKKQLICAFVLLCGAALAQAQEKLPYKANWQYKAEAVADDGTVTEADPKAGRYLSDQSTWDLGGWTSVATEYRNMFYIGITKGTPIANTMEYVDGQQKQNSTAWLISPALDFSAAADKTISFKCGKEADDQCSSVLEVLYTTDFTGDPTTTEWTTLKADIRPVTGMKGSMMGVEKIRCKAKADKVYIAIKTTKAGDNYFSAGAKQAKIRVMNFQVK
ncbi:MAG: choice-of-anchor J domain-containing protein [Bacteroidaceae bacterium]